MRRATCQFYNQGRSRKDFFGRNLQKFRRKYLTFCSEVYAHIVEKKFYDLGSRSKVGYKINIGRYKLFEMGRENEKEER